MHTTHTSRTQSRSGSHVSHEENTRTMQLEIDHLRRRCTANDEDELLPILTSLLTMIEMAVTGPSQGLPPVNLSRVMRTTTMSVEIRAHLAKA